MKDRLRLSRRAFTGGALALTLNRTPVFAQGFAGLGMSGDGFAPVVPGKVFTFPSDHGPHPEFRIEWWYVTANLVDPSGVAYGAQWTLFRQATKPGVQLEGWANQQVWMGHAAVTRSDTHRFAEIFARGGVGQAGVEANPFEAWIDAWQMRGLGRIDDNKIAPLELKAAGENFSYVLRLDADRALVLQGEAGYSRKSERGQASYYFSQPYFQVTGNITLDDRAVKVTGKAWMDREWSSQPLASDQTGWDWFSLHLNSGEKMMLFRLSHKEGDNYISGNWILPEGKTQQLVSSDIIMTPTSYTDIAGRKIPTVWEIAIPKLSLNISCTPLNPRSWMGTSFPYWEGPINFRGSHDGVGYLEMTGY
jgi:predicted secreted hydrolase